MWFAALGSYQQNGWFVNLAIRLLQGSSDVIDLLERNPFPGTPPIYIRATLYQYHFTDSSERDSTGNVWRRERLGLYLPPFSLNETQAADE